MDAQDAGRGEASQVNERHPITRAPPGQWRAASPAALAANPLVKLLLPFLRRIAPPLGGGASSSGGGGGGGAGGDGEDPGPALARDALLLLFSSLAGDGEDKVWAEEAGEELAVVLDTWASVVGGLPAEAPPLPTEVAPAAVAAAARAAAAAAGRAPAAAAAAAAPRVAAEGGAGALGGEEEALPVAPALTLLRCLQQRLAQPAGGGEEGAGDEASLSLLLQALAGAGGEGAEEPPPPTLFRAPTAKRR